MVMCVKRQLTKQGGYLLAIYLPEGRYLEYTKNKAKQRS